MDAEGVTGAVDAVGVAGVAGVAGSVAKERRARPSGKTRCISLRALRRERMLLRPNRLAHAATASRAWVNRAKARTGQAVAIRDKSVAMAEAKPVPKVEVMAALKVAATAEASSAAMAGPKVAVKVAAGVHAAPDGMSPLALRRPAAWPRPWTHRVFFPWISQVPTKLLIQRERVASGPSPSCCP